MSRSSVGADKNLWPHHFLIRFRKRRLDSRVWLWICALALTVINILSIETIIKIETIEHITPQCRPTPYAIEIKEIANISKTKIMINCDLHLH